MRRTLILVFLLWGFSVGARRADLVRKPPTFDGITSSTINSPSREPNPSSDIRAFGARDDGQKSLATTCTTTSGNANVTIRSAETFKNGSGIMCVGAGAPIRMRTPAAPTVTSSLAAGPMQTGRFVANGAGSTSYTYKVVAEDFAGGLTAASAARTIADGPATLGANTAIVSSWTRLNRTITFMTASAHGIVVNAMVEIGSDTTLGNPFYCKVTTVQDNRHFTCESNQDTRNGAPVASGSAGTVTWRSANHIVTENQNGVLRYWIYGGSCGTNKLCGVTLPRAILGHLSNDPLNLTWDDWGLGLTGAPPHPSWVPTSIASNPMKADNLVTTILSGGGTTRLTLATNATTSVSGQLFQECIDPAFNAAVAAVHANGLGGGTVVIPITSGGVTSFSTCGVVQVPSVAPGTVIRVNGSLQLGDTLILNGGQMIGDPNGFSNTVQFSRSGYVRLTSTTAPLLLLTTSKVRLERIWFNTANQGVGWLDEGPSSNQIPGWDVEKLLFSSNNPTHDELVRYWVVRGNSHGGADFLANTVNFSAGTGIGNTTNTPVFISTGNDLVLHATDWFTNFRGFYFGDGIKATFSEVYCQQCLTPKFMVDWNPYGAGSGQITMELWNSIEDTSAAPQIAALDPKSSGVVKTSISTGVVLGSLFTAQNQGVVFHTEAIPIFENDIIGVVGKHLPIPSFCVDGILSTGVSPNCPLEFNNLTTIYGKAYGWALNGNAPPAFKVNVRSGGTIPVGSHQFSYAYVYPASGGGFTTGMYTRAAPINITAGNQTILFTATPLLGAVGYSLSMDGFLVECKEPFQAGQGTTVTWNGFPARCGQSQPGYPGGGPVSASKDGVYAAKFAVTSAGGYTSSITSAATATRQLILPDASGQVAVSPISFKLFIQAAVCSGATATSTWNLPAVGAPRVNCRSGKNVQEATLDFADGDSAQYQYLLPLDWEAGSLDARVLLLSSDESGVVVFQIATACSSVNGSDSDDVPYEKLSSFAPVTLAAPADAQRTATVTGIATAGCLPGNSIGIKLVRGNDTATARVRVKGIELTIRRTI